MAKAIAARTGQKLDIYQQCISEGAANLVGSFFQCFPGSGSLTRSAVNQQAGAVSQWSGVFAAVAVAGTVLLLAPLAQYIPRASLAGLLMLAAFRMVDREQLVFHLRATRFDAGVVIATALAAVAISVEFCILIGVFLSFVLYVPRAAHVRMTQLIRTPDHGLRVRLPHEPADDALLVYQLEGEVFFGTEPDLEAQCAAIASAARKNVRAVILILERARNPDAAFLHLLRTLDGRLKKRGVRLILAGVATTSCETFACTGMTMQTGSHHLFCDTSKADGSECDIAPSACYLINHAACSSCPRREPPPATPSPLDYVL
jgi:SulP family sulfate permease